MRNNYKWLIFCLIFVTITEAAKGPHVSWVLIALILLDAVVIIFGAFVDEALGNG